MQLLERPDSCRGRPAPEGRLCSLDRQCRPFVGERVQSANSGLQRVEIGAEKQPLAQLMPSLS